MESSARANVGGMVDERRLPVIIGVGDLRSNRGKTVADAREPADLIAEALRLAAEDSTIGLKVLAMADRLDLVRVISWDYEDLPGEVARRLTITPAATDHSSVGGNRPPMLVDEAARRIADGEIDVALVAGAETAASMSAFAKAGIEPPWPKQPGGPVQFPRELAGTELVIRHNLTRPIRAYPLYENGLRADLGQTFAESQHASAQMYSAFSAVAATRAAAWNQAPMSVEEIETVSADNRMICYPYPLRMNALAAVDQAAAVIVTSLAQARELGVPDHHVVHVWGGAGSADSRDILSRVSYSRSPAMASMFDSTLSQAGISSADVDVVDLYSCFPCVPKLAARHLQLDDDMPRSVTGGLTSFGGPGNNYTTHAIVAMVERLRSGNTTGAKVGLVYGNGELVTKHHAILLARVAHPHGYVGNPDPVTPPAEAPPAIVEQPDGAAVVETFTVEFDRAGVASRGFVVGRLDDGRRFVANTAEGDGTSLDGLTDPDREPIGRRGSVSVGPKGRNLFELTA
jgi:acetyl-CoA C-acetyltransferase